MIKKTLIIKINGSERIQMLADATYIEDSIKKPIIVFSHGFKGYKDWGPWGLMAEAFANAGFFFLKFNFSHNGGTIKNPIDFPDLDSFSKNTYKKELDDLCAVIDFVAEKQFYPEQTDKRKIYLLGHSRGGGVSILASGKRSVISKLSVMSSISDIWKRFPTGELLQKWKEEGVYYISNSRTKQKMPVLYSAYESALFNKQDLDIHKVAKSFLKPALIIHAKDDRVVGLDEALELDNSFPKSELVILENGGHTFDAKHPWEETSLPKSMQSLVARLIEFYKK